MKAEVKVVEMIAQLPPFWNRQVVFYANLLALFFGNEIETQTLKEKVGEVDSYGGRLIPILNLLFAGGENLLVLEREPDGDLCDYFTKSLGLELPGLSVLPHEDYLALAGYLRSGDVEGCAPYLADTRGHSADYLDGFVTDSTLDKIADQLEMKTIASSVGSKRGNNKLMLLQHVEAAGLPFVPMHLAETREEIVEALKRLNEAGYEKAVVKAQIGASGIGMIKIDDTGSAAGLPAIPDHLFFEGPCMVQGWLAPGTHGVTRMRSPSVQMFLDDETVYLYDVTEQLLSESSVHEGNISPPPYLGEHEGLLEEMLRQAGVAGKWLHEQGYRGTASTDLLLVDYEGRDEPEVYICEVNARVTGATYPSVLARHFTPGNAWLMRNIRLSKPCTGRELLAHMRELGHLFEAGDEAGILPINFNFGADGLVHKGQFLCLAPTPEGCYELLTAAEEDVVWEYERD